MERSIPRVVLAGTNSGCGKTTVTCAILQALVDRGLRVGAFKCGPDYIDPMFHSRVIGARSANLDGFFFTENTMKLLLAENGTDREFSLIEGVMGYYDGMGFDTQQASTYETAQITQSPVVLVVNVRGAAQSVLATIHGFCSFRPNSRIQGVILDQCSAMSYIPLAKAIREEFQGEVEPLGYLPPMPECGLESRHLGLVTAAEVEGLREKLHRLSEQAEKSVDLEGLMALAQSAPPVEYQPLELPHFEETIRIGVAQDKAFCFLYADSLDLLARLGAELVPFSPLEDKTLPENLDALYLCGGYPELYAQALSENISMRQAVKAALAENLPCIAECGGFMYLTEAIGTYPMVGALPGKCFDTGKLTRFGYVTLTAREDNLLCAAGETLPGHEFHHWDCDCLGKGFTAAKRSGKHWDCVVTHEQLYAGYPHIHFWAVPQAAIRFYQICLKERQRHDRTH